MKKIIISSVLFAIGTIFIALATAVASSPWLWEMTLQQGKGRSVMSQPTAIYIDRQLERYYVVDGRNNRLLSYNRKGDFLSEFSGGNQLKSPFDMVREEGVLWVVEKGRNSLTRIDLKAKKIKPNIIMDNGTKVYPDRLEIENDSIYLLDKARGIVLGLNRDLKVKQRFGCDNCDYGFVDFKLAKGKLWALEQSEEAVYVFSLTGKLEKTVQLEGDLMEFPRSLALDDTGFFYVLDRHKGEIFVFDSSGKFKYSFLALGQARGQLYYPVEIKFDPWGYLCVVDEGNGRVQFFSHK
jgi:sugar lactone lactonase YvrE